ncbi:MAG: toprim domain-containing protein [Pseudomonadota bacterium]
MNGRVTIQEVKSLLQARMLEYCKQMLPRGRREAGKWVSNNPITADDKKSPALKVHLDGSQAGAWKCWRSGDGGDAIGLCAYLNGFPARDNKSGMKFAAEFLGLSRMLPAERRDLRKQAENARKKQDEEAQKKRLWRLQAAKKLFFSATESWKEWAVAGCCEFMPVQRHFVEYLAGRNIAIDQIPYLDESTFRFSPGTEYWKLAEWRYENGRRRKVKPGPEFPAVHSAMRNAFGQITACHVTFLDPLQPVKAPLDPPKLMFGEALGSFISISKGKSGEDPITPQDPALVGISEGIETAFTIAEAMPDERIWAAGSLAGFKKLPLDLPCVGKAILCRDNNTGNDQAQRQFDAAVEALEAFEKPVAIIAPPDPAMDDFNDLATQG